MTDQANDATSAKLDPYYDQLPLRDRCGPQRRGPHLPDIVRHHSSYGFWTPTTTEEAPKRQHFIQAAQRDVLSRLRLVIASAENVLTSFEADRAKAMNRPPPCPVPGDG